MLLEPDRKLEVFNSENRERILRGKSFVITGVSNGIGAAIADYAARLGARPIIGIDMDAPAKISALANMDELHVVPVYGDVTRPDKLDEIATQLQDREVEVDYLVINAGVTQSKTGRSISKSEQEKIQKVNTEGSINTWRAFNHLLKPGGTVLVVSSDMATDENPSKPIYADSKKKQALWTQELARENQGVRVVTLLTGPVNTRLFRSQKTPEEIHRIEQGVGVMSPDHFAYLVTHFILPDRETYPSGSLIRVYRNSVEMVPPEVFLSAAEWKQKFHSERWRLFEDKVALTDAIHFIPNDSYADRTGDSADFKLTRLLKIIPTLKPYADEVSYLYSLPDDTLRKIFQIFSS